jgi:hypothetical protein
VSISANVRDDSTGLDEPAEMISLLSSPKGLRVELFSGRQRHLSSLLPPVPLLPNLNRKQLPHSASFDEEVNCSGVSFLPHAQNADRM